MSRKILKQKQQSDEEKIVSLKTENMNLLETIAIVYEGQLQSEINNFEAIAELYEFVIGGAPE